MVKKINISIIVCILVLTVNVVGKDLPKEFDSTADAAAIITSGDVRFTVLTPRVVRMEWSQDGQFEDLASLVFVNRALPVPEFRKSEKGGWLEIRTTALTLRYRLGSGRFTRDNLNVSFLFQNKKRTWVPGLENKGDLKGTIRTLDGTDGQFYLDDSGKHESPIELEPGLLSRDGWCLLDDTDRPLFDDSDWPWVMARPQKPHQDLYFFGYGLDFKQALKDFTRLAGPIALPPRFAFGYWNSRYWPYSDAELRELVERFEALNLPLDVLVIDMDWHLTSNSEFFKDGKRVEDQAGESIGWTGYTWNRNFFPDPDDLLAWLEGKGIKTCLNLHPASGIQPHEEKYPEMASAMGIDPATKKFVPFEITNKKFAQHYFDLVLHPMEKAGIDFWWLDWQQWSTTSIAGVNPTFYLNYVHFSDMERQGKRPFIYHRWGGLGNHRYQIGFSGDTLISWATLNYQPYFTATASNVGFGYWGHDIGGHYGTDAGQNDPELLTRWFQWGVFSPILKTHATDDPSLKRNPWEFGSETLFRIKELLGLRYSLIPYIYSTARTAYDTGVSLLRPLYYEDPGRKEAYQFPNEYYFGPDMIVAPVTSPLEKDSLLTTQKLWLPPGDWYEWATGTLLAGGRVVERPFTLDEIPVYVRGGAIIPMQPAMRNTSEKAVDPLILKVFPGKDAEVRIYEDEGNTLGFKRGQFSYTPVQSRHQDNRQAILIGPVSGSFPGQLPARSYELHLVRCLPPKGVTVNGVSWPYSEKPALGTWSYDGRALTFVLRIPPQPLTEPLAVEIVHDGADAACLNGVAGAFKRLFTFAKFLSTVRIFFYQDLWNDGLYSGDLVVRTAEAGYAISRKPQTIMTELNNLDVNLPKIIAMVEANMTKLSAPGDAKDKLDKDIRKRYAKNDAQSLYLPYLNLLKSIGRPRTIK
jgi:alpha-glucosidase (family GH31 glycosyl hydrolase)